MMAQKAPPHRMQLAFWTAADRAVNTMTQPTVEMMASAAILRLTQRSLLPSLTFPLPTPRDVVVHLLTEIYSEKRFTLGARHGAWKKKTSANTRSRYDVLPLCGVSVGLQLNQLIRIR